jgi:hypothetical protein
LVFSISNASVLSILPYKSTTKSYTGKDFYKSYIDYVGDNPLYQVEYRVFRDIINDYFKYLRDELIENGKEIKLPCRLGTLSIVKHKPKEYSGRSLRIDYAEIYKRRMERTYVCKYEKLLELLL